jgi:NAD(P)-dependent dehydrogenase (short-subunit alcohol dehydrogenase family)
MIQRKQPGSIINICSTAAYDPTCGSYSVSKAGLLMATKAMAYKLGPYNIRVNSVTPGCIQTDMSRRGWTDNELSPSLAEKLPLRRGGQPNEIAAAVLYLASDEASFTTGADIAVDGGFLLQGIH